MGDSALGKIQTIDDKVSASSTDNTPDFLDGKVDGTTLTVNGSNKLQREALTGDVTTIGNAATVVGGNADTVTTNANLTGGVTSVGNAATVVTNANLTGVVTSVGNATAIANKALAIAKLADGTDGELITWDGSGVVDTVAAGTSTQVLTSNGAGFAPTFQAAGGGVTACAFRARLLSSGTGTTLTWDEVGGYDIGSNFASNTFTAPVTGIYAITVCMKCVLFVDAAASSTLTLSGNGATYRGHNHASLTNLYDSCIVTANMQLDASDTVTVARTSSSGNFVPVDASIADCYWTGILIQES